MSSPKRAGRKLREIGFLYIDELASDDAPDTLDKLPLLLQRQGTAAVLSMQTGGSSWPWSLVSILTSHSSGVSIVAILREELYFLR